MANKEKSIDVLDQIKNIEKTVKAKMLIQSISELKKMCKEVSTLKEKCVITLEEIGIDEVDIKRIIDFVNELPEVKLTSDDKKSIRDTIKNSTKNQRENVAKKIGEEIDLHNYNYISAAGTTSTANSIGYTTSATSVNFVGGMGGNQQLSVNV